MRLIDADFLIKTLNEQNIPVDVRVNYEIMDAPTIEPDGDLISRQAAIETIMCEPPDAHYPSWYASRIKALPSAESTGAMDEAIQKYIKDGYMQPIGEDLISRQGVLDAINHISADEGLGMVDLKEIVESLPSAPDSRQRGEWVGCTGCEHYDQQQTKLICHECKRYYSDKYKDGEDK